MAKWDHLFEADAKLQRLLRATQANMSDGDAARRFFMEASRQGNRVFVMLGNNQHFIVEWHDDGQITTRTMTMNLFGPAASAFQNRRHNHSNWDALGAHKIGMI